MKTIRKYPLRHTLLQNSRNSFLMPSGAVPLTVRMRGMEGGLMCLLALVDSNPRSDELRCFDIYGTECSMPDNPGAYIDTVELGVLIWHIFEATMVPADRPRA